MRKLKLEVHLSIDGYIADRQDRTDWMIWNWEEYWSCDEQLREYHIDLTRSCGAILLSAEMADQGFHRHWEAIAGDAADPRCSFARVVADMPKVVFARTLTTFSWNNTEVTGGDLVRGVEQLKAGTGRDLITYGGGTFATTLINARLIDEFHFFIHPVIVGDGRPFLEEGSVARLNLELATCDRFSCGVSVLRYFLKP